MDTHFIHSIYTVVMLVIFVGIWGWAWSSKQKKRFHEAANLPFADEQEQLSSIKDEREKESKHE